MKIKVIKLKRDNDYCYECGNSEVSVQGITKWNEIDDPEYQELIDQVNAANNNKKSKWFYIIVHQVEDFHEIYDTAAEFIAAEKDRQEKEKIKTMEFGKRRDAAILKRKKAQFEKLEKELKNFNSAI